MEYQFVWRVLYTFVMSEGSIGFLRSVWWGIGGVFRGFEFVLVFSYVVLVVMFCRRSVVVKG